MRTLISRSLLLGLLVVGSLWLGVEMVRPYWDQDLKRERELWDLYKERQIEIDSVIEAWISFRLEEFWAGRLPESLPIPRRLRAEEVETIDWYQWGNTMSYRDLSQALVPNHLASLPEKDGLGFPYQFRVKEGVLALRLPGCDGAFEESNYSFGRFSMDECHRDEVVVGGSYVQRIYVPALDYE